MTIEAGESPDQAEEFMMVTMEFHPQDGEMMVETGESRNPDLVSNTSSIRSEMGVNYKMTISKLYIR